MPRKQRAFVLLLVLVAAGPAARADVINVSTGLDNSNQLIMMGGVSDAHWNVSEQVGGTGAAQTVDGNSADSVFFSWVPNGPNSDWIARDASTSDNGPAPYTFTTTFDLTGYNLATVALAGLWAVDDEGTVDLNGHVLSTLSPNLWSQLTPFSTPSGGADFVQGLNTLNITITSSDQFLEGVRLEGTVTATPASVPEPGPLALGGVSGLIWAAIAWRRKRRASAH